LVLIEPAPKSARASSALDEKWWPGTFGLLEIRKVNWEFSRNAPNAAAWAAPAAH
jgi:hypothetical protein